MSKKMKPSEKEKKRAKALPKKAAASKKGARSTKAKKSPARRQAAKESSALRNEESPPPAFAEEMASLVKEEAPIEAPSVTSSVLEYIAPEEIPAPPADAAIVHKEEVVALQPQIASDEPAASDRGASTHRDHTLPPAGTIVHKYDRRGEIVASIKILDDGRIQLIHPEGVDKIFDSPTGAALAHTRMLGNGTKAINGWTYFGFQKPPRSTTKNKASVLERLLARRTRAQEALAACEAEIDAYLNTEDAEGTLT